MSPYSRTHLPTDPIRIPTHVQAAVERAAAYFVAGDPLADRKIYPVSGHPDWPLVLSWFGDTGARERIYQEIRRTRCALRESQKPASPPAPRLITLIGPANSEGDRELKTYLSGQLVARGAIFETAPVFKGDSSGYEVSVEQVPAVGGLIVRIWHPHILEAFSGYAREVERLRASSGRGTEAHGTPAVVEVEVL